ncbi:MAG: PSD1 and planctomycete cytochrome C domain-containing protein [Planctomycetota bacterium]|nr:PSD1 and planctomycete cytochrome C domain-containing protein [Planctomycetota bacterium]
MSRSIFLFVVTVLAGSFVAAADNASADALPAAVTRVVDFERDVRPILESRCAECHSKDDPTADIQILSRRSLLRGGESGEPAIVLSRSADSFLIKVVAGLDPDVRMPPKGPRLSSEQIAILRGWIDQGLKMPGSETPADAGKTGHWSFQPVGNPEPPRMDDRFVASPIDSFVLKKLKEQVLVPSPRADRRSLIRRLFLVMLGLPPTSAQVAAFVSDGSPDAWKNLIDNVLDSPQYGERWARHWLDLIRFGETHGFETNRERPNAWYFRDWVIESLNSDKPYDEFVRQQIAGDAFGEPIGTGFLVAGPHDIVKGQDPNLTLMQRQDELSDLINATTTAFLGMTIGCARCHNHKFDPITQRDFYAVQAVFAGVEHGDRRLPVPEDRQEQIAAIRLRIENLRQQLRGFIPPSSNEFREAVSAKHNVDRFAPVKARFVRFTILRTNSSQPCIDELEIFSDKENVALASSGAVATCSSSLPGYPIHKLEHVNDGVYGNSRSWISNEAGGGWVQIEFPDVQTIRRLEWARDRESRFSDRLAIEYRIDTAINAGEWTSVASSDDRRPFGDSKKSVPVYRFDNVTEELATQGRQWLAQLDAAEQEAERLAVVPTVYAGTFRQPGPTHRLYRGDHNAKREIVGPDAIQMLGSLKLDGNAPEQQRRVAFAEWIADSSNPLTARVIVNRLWQFHFGTGIVDTPSDFGANGTTPSHPELLDWLARDLMTNGWSLKHVHRQILMSNTWQQDSRPIADSMKVDGATRLLWRFPPRRIEAEVIRDSMLAVSGQLNSRMGGPGFSGFEVEMENVRHFHPKVSFGPEDFRRMIYMTKVRQEQESVFGSFDCPDASQVTPERSRSTTPLQALNLLNSSFVIEQSEFLAARLTTEAPQTTGDKVHLAFELCFSREPTSDELSDSVTFIEQSGLMQFCRAMLNANELVFIP